MCVRYIPFPLNTSTRVSVLHGSFSFAENQPNASKHHTHPVQGNQLSKPPPKSMNTLITRAWPHEDTQSPKKIRLKLKMLLIPRHINYLLMRRKLPSKEMNLHHLLMVFCCSNSSPAAFIDTYWPIIKFHSESCDGENLAPVLLLPVIPVCGVFCVVCLHIYLFCLE